MPHDAARTDETPAPSRLPRGVRALLRVPLFYKILIANAALVLVGTIFGSMVTARFVRDQPGRPWFEVAGLLALIGIGITLLVNAVILRVALRPLDELERTAARVQKGEADCRAPDSPVADRELDRLRLTFNAMLDAGAAYRARLRELAARALGAAEEERKRIARELHDETAQMLAALLIRIRVVQRQQDPAALARLLEEMRGDVGQALEGIRRFARGLRPPALDELGLVPAIESHARSLREISGLEIEVESDDVSGGLPPQAELATRATVRITHGDGRLVVTVEDDGRGFDPDNALSTDGGGLGLFGMKERAGYIGGRVDVSSEPGRGTRVRAEIPLREDDAEA